MPKLEQPFWGYSEDYRRTVVARVDPRSRTAGIAAVARAEGLPERTVRRWYNDSVTLRQVPSLAHSGGREPRLSANEKRRVYGWLDADNTLTNQQLATRAWRHFGKRVTPQTIGRYLAAAEPPFVRMTASRVDPDVMTDATMVQRIAFSRRRSRVPRSKHVYADEKFLYLRRPGTRVRGRRGSRQWTVAPYHSKRVLLFCGLTLEGWFGAKLVDDQLNDRTFTEWAAEDLVPHLQRGDVLYIDQLGKGSAAVPSSMHYNHEFVQAVRARRAQLEHTPRKSPQANPVELMFNYIESAVRRRAASTFDGLWAVVLRRLNSITPTMIRRWFERRATDADMVEQELALGIDRRSYTV